MRVIGLDLSLTSTGVAPSDGDPYRIKTTSSQSLPKRLHIIADGIKREVDKTAQDVLLVIEEVPSHAAFSITGLAKVHGAVLYVLGEDTPYVYVTPPVLKKYATGKGNANKDVVLAAAIRRFDFEGTSNDEADAWILMNLGLELLGKPVVTVPEAHKEGKGFKALVETLEAA
jgi:Holliday junction resolvasome RuvABC endonuclease subunit